MPNDIDLLVIGRPDRDDVHEAALRAQQRLGREVNVTLRTRDAGDRAGDGFTRQSAPLRFSRSGALSGMPRRNKGSELVERLLEAPTPARAGWRGDR